MDIQQLEIVRATLSESLARKDDLHEFRRELSES